MPITWNEPLYSDDSTISAGTPATATRETSPRVTPSDPGAEFGIEHDLYGSQEHWTRADDRAANEAFRLTMEYRERDKRDADRRMRQRVWSIVNAILVTFAVLFAIDLCDGGGLQRTVLSLVRGEGIR